MGCWVTGNVGVLRMEWRLLLTIFVSLAGGDRMIVLDKFACVKEEAVVAYLVERCPSVCLKEVKKNNA